MNTAAQLTTEFLTLLALKVSKWALLMIAWMFSVIVVLMSDAAVDTFSNLARGLAGWETSIERKKTRATQQRRAVKNASRGIRGRTQRMVARNAGDAVISGVPVVGAATVALAVWDIHDLCATIEELNALEVAFGETPPDSAVLESCRLATDAADTAATTTSEMGSALKQAHEDAVRYAERVFEYWLR